MMRIITGSAKGMKLKTLDGFDTRPTTERTKEAVFSMIQFEIDGRDVLDLFAGSGQMGLEALSRGAASAFFVDHSPESIKIIKQNATHTRLFDKSRFRISDYRNYLRKAGALEKRMPQDDPKNISLGSFDLVFLDPPYEKGILTDAMIKLANSGLLRPCALLVCECAKEERPDENPEILALYEVVKTNAYGRTFIYIFMPKLEIFDLAKDI